MRPAMWVPPAALAAGALAALAVMAAAAANPGPARAAAPPPAPAAAAPDTLQFHARSALTDTLLDRLVGVWQGSPPGDPATVDRLVGQWKYEHTLLMLQSRVATGARKDFEMVGFVTRDAGGRYRMSYADASGMVLYLEGREEGLALVLSGSGPESQVRLRYDLSRRGRLLLTREEAPAPGGEFRKVLQFDYVRGRLHGR
ncbi:MAG TPA: hypothetical protein VMS93_09435 [Candidatus Saccharimonadales bacterium]|nr:hypothetical protein [Candidatus Saccharimonadales bacterium]